MAGSLMREVCCITSRPEYVLISAIALLADLAKRHLCPTARLKRLRYGHRVKAQAQSVCVIEELIRFRTQPPRRCTAESATSLVTKALDIYMCRRDIGRPKVVMTPLQEAADSVRKGPAHED